MPTRTDAVYGPDGRLLESVVVEVPDEPADPIAVIQAQVDALTDIVLGGAA